MLTQKIKSVSAALGEMAGAVPQDQWKKIRRIRAELEDAAQIAKHLEKRMPVPEANPAGALERAHEIRKRFLEGGRKDG